MYKRQVVNMMMVMSKWMFDDIFVVTYPKTAATPDLHSASRGLAVTPCPTHTAAL